MAQMGFAVAGAVVGSFFGMPQLGWMAGAAIGGLLFPAKGPDVEGPRLGDLSVSSSAYGMPVPIIYGTMRVAGNMIWSSGIREVKKKQKVGGKGGGGGSTTSYTYYASFAVAFGEGPADDVLRIWADSKLIYDKTTTSAGTTKAGLKFRFYPGDETQLPDPLIEADVGAGRAPAHRGLCVIVFEDSPLADFGNRVPNINAEITYNKVSERPVVPLQHMPGAAVTGFYGDHLATDWTRGYGYLLRPGFDDVAGVLRRFSLTTMQEDRQVRLLDVFSPPPASGPEEADGLFCGVDSHVYLTIGSGDLRPVVKIDPYTLREVARFGENSVGVHIANTTEAFCLVQWMAMPSAYGLSGRVDYLFTGGFFANVGVINVADMSYVWGADQRVDEGRVGGIVRGIAGEGYGEGWVLGSSSSDNYGAQGIYRMRLSSNAGVDPVTGESVGVTFEKLATLTPGMIIDGATEFRERADGFTYDSSDGGLIFRVRILPGPVEVVLKWRADLGIVWATPLPAQVQFWSYGAWAAQARIEYGRWTWMRAQGIVQLDTATGAIVYNESWPEVEWASGAQIYDGASDALIVSTQGGLVKIYLGRGAGGGDTLAAIVADLSGRSGLAEGDIDVGELDDVVPGYVISRQTTVRGAIEPLAQAYFFDGVEIDYQLRYLKRGRASAASIPAASLVPMSDEESWRERRTQEVDLPERVSVISLNRDMNYQQGAQSEKRIQLPVPAMHSRNQVAVELPIAMDATTAKRIAARMLYLAWIERAGYECILPPPWLGVDPTDVVTVEFAGGGSFRSRTTRVDVGADFTLSMKGVSDAVAAYTSTVAADGGAGLPVQTIGVSLASFLVLADVPLLRDVDDTGGAGSRLYFAGGGYGEAGWRGAVLYRSVDGVTWAGAGTISEEVVYGYTVNALGAPAGSAFCTDNDNELVVAMTTGGDELESVTQDAMVAGIANAALLLKANGEPEVIQFREVTYNAEAGNYTLRGLLRGRRGTDVFASDHAAGELFVLLEVETMDAAMLNLADLDVTRQWRAVSVGSLFEDAEIRPHVATGRDLKPYAPWAVKAAVDAGDIVISWARRTRIGGELRDGTGTVPLSEASEAYEVDILEGPGGAVLRTLESATESVVYLAAAIGTDFGDMPAALSVAVYQISAVAGRGFARSVALEVS